AWHRRCFVGDGLSTPRQEPRSDAARRPDRSRHHARPVRDRGAQPEPAALAVHPHGRNPADRGRPAGRPPAGDRAERELPGELQRRSRLVHDRALGGGQLGRRLHALAQQKLEQLRSMPLGAAQVAPNSYTDPANPLRADGTGGGTFSRTWTVSANDSPTFGLRTVTVRVSWRDTRLHVTTLAAYIRCSTIPC